MVLRHIPLRGVSSLNLLCSCQCEDWNHPPLTLHVICPKTFRFDQFFQLWTWRRLGIYSGGEITIFISIAVGVAFTYPSLKTTLAGLAIINFREIFTSQDSFPWSGIIAQKIKSIQKLPNLFHYFRLKAKYDFVKKEEFGSTKKFTVRMIYILLNFFVGRFLPWYLFSKKSQERSTSNYSIWMLSGKGISTFSFRLPVLFNPIKSSQSEKTFWRILYFHQKSWEENINHFFCTINNSSLDPRHLLPSSDMSPTL